MSFSRLCLLLPLLAGAVRHRARRHARVDGRGKVIGLGDSYSSGTGIHLQGNKYTTRLGGEVTLGGKTYRFTPSAKNDCWREETSTTAALYAKSVNMNLVVLACKGAKVPQVVSQLEYLNAKYTDDAKIGWPNSVIMLTAGGNDLVSNRGESWVKLITRCILFEKDCHLKPENQINNLLSIRSELLALHTKLATTAPNARIRILSYPRLMQSQATKCSGVLVNKEEADWIDSIMDKLNNVTESAVMEVSERNPDVDISFVDVSGEITKGACSSEKESQLNGVMATSWINRLPSHASFHPKQTGYDGYFRAVWKDLNRGLGK